jgi:Tol biopolymer transport system component
LVRLPPTATFAVAAAAAALACAGPAAATFGGEPQKVAYETYEDGSTVYTVRPTGDGHRRVLRDASMPAWSRDGRKIAFIRNNDVWRASADGSRQRRVVDAMRLDGVANHPSWSPGGRRIAFQLQTEEEVGEEDLVIRNFVNTVRADGSGRRSLRPGSAPAWSPAGGRIAFTTADGIATIRPSGRGYRDLARTGDGFDSALDFSPDGRRLAFIHYGLASNDDISVRTLDLRTARAAVVPSEGIGVPGDVAWTPGGRRLAYLRQPDAPASRPSPPTEMHTIAPDGSRPRHLFTFKPGLWASAFSWQARPR